MTPEDYKNLASEAYRVDRNVKDKQVLHEGDVFTVNGKKWEVLKSEDSTENGFQAMAVAPKIDGETDTSQVVIAYAGTNPSDWKDLAVDGLNVMGSVGGFQLDSANRFANEVAKAYPYSDISTTGHSLGAFLALAQGAEHHWQSVTFNGPDPYSVLSPQAKAWVKQNPGMLTNFLNQMDLVGYGGDIIARFKNGKLLWSVLGQKIDTTGSEVVLNYGFLGLNPLNYHDLNLWKFDEKGNILDGKGKSHGIPQQAVLNSKMTQLSHSFKVQMEALGVLKKTLTESAGGLSSSEKIYLDSAQALAIVSTAGAEFQLAMTNVIQVYQNGIKETENLWMKTLSDAVAVGSQLEKWEVYAALESVGVTENNIVGIPTQLYQHKMDQVKQMSDKFKQLEREIKEKISDLLARDAELAQELKG